MADGQLAASLATIEPAASHERTVQVYLYNTGGSSETVTLSVLRSGGSARTWLSFPLATLESCLTPGIYLAAGDVIQGSATDATTVNYFVSPAPTPGGSLQVWDANGAAKGNASASGIGAGGVIVLTGTATPSLTTDTGQTNTGFLTVKGKTSGQLKITTADSTGQTVTVSAAAQTVGASTWTIPDAAGAAQTFVSLALAQELTNKTLTAQVVKTGLTASGSASNDFSSSTGTFKTSTGTNTLSGNTLFKLIATPVAATGAGGGVGGAAALGAANFVLISSDGATKGVKLLTGAAGDVKFILNTSGTAANLFAASGGTINGGAADAGCAIPASKGVIAICTAADTWSVFDLTAQAGAAA